MAVPISSRIPIDLDWYGMRKERYRVVRLGNRNGRFYCKDKLTGSRTSLKTTDRQEAELLVQHKNQAIQNAHINRRIGMAYLSTADPMLTKRVWQDVMDDIVQDKQGPTLHRWKTAIKDSAFDPIRKQVVVTTATDDFMGVLRKGTISTNVFLRRFGPRSKLFLASSLCPQFRRPPRPSLTTHAPSSGP